MQLLHKKEQIIQMQALTDHFAFKNSLWHGMLSCWKQPEKSEDGYCGNKGMEMVSKSTQLGCDF